MKKLFILFLLVLLSTVLIRAQAVTKYEIYSKILSVSQTEVKVFVSSDKLESEEIIFSYVFSVKQAPGENPYRKSNIREGLVNLTVSEDAIVNYNQIRYYGWKDKSQASEQFDPYNKKGKIFLASTNAAISAFQLIGLVNGLMDYWNEIEGIVNEEIEVETPFDPNYYDQVENTFNSIGMEFIKVQVDIPVRFNQNFLIGIGSTWSVKGFDKQGNEASKKESVGIFFNFFNLKDKLNDINSGINLDPKSGSFTDERDGHVYKWVRIGEQIWMAENLAYLPEVSPPSTESFTNPVYYVNGYFGTNSIEAKTLNDYKKYGVIYNWPAALKSCPKGWHLPSDNEWDQLIKYIDKNEGPFKNEENWWYEVGKYLKAKNGWDEGNGTDYYGFSAIPGCTRWWAGKFDNDGTSCTWWSSTSDHTDLANLRSLNSSDIYTYDTQNTKAIGYNVRCIND